LHTTRPAGILTAMADATAQAHADVARRARESAALVLRGIALNLALAVVKFLGGIFGHTYALIADGVESLADVFSSLLVWFGFRLAGRPPDANHPYGHGKAEALAGLVIALGLLLAAAWIAVHAVREIITPHQNPAPWTLLLLVGIVTAKILFSRRMHRTGRDEGSDTLQAEAWHHISDAITSGAAFMGISISVLGGPAYAAADDWAALVACVVVAGNGCLIGYRAVGEMMDLAPPPALEAAVRKVAAAVPGVVALEKCRLRKSGLSHLVDIHVEVDPDLTVRAGHDIAGAVKQALLTSDLRITDVLVHLEPANTPLNTTPDRP
jgi:cation diffusion facilitator family transporter